jgi:4-aminobutyrate aminotransferase
LPPSTSEEEIVKHSLYHLDLVFSQQVNPLEVAAILIEPVLGEGGYVPAPPAYLRGLRELCDKYGIMLILDEVQTGFCRTGKTFAIEFSGVRPDIMVIAKVCPYSFRLVSVPDPVQGLANGFPLSGIISRKELTDKLKPGVMVCLA